MFTQCPQCDAVFQLSASQLAAANGEVRCGQCLSVFNALENLSEGMPPTNEKDSEELLAQEAEQYRDWSSQKTADETVDDSPENQPSAAENNDNSDVFNDIVTEASAQAISTEEIDRFEAFLETPAEELAPSEQALADTQAAAETEFETTAVDPSPGGQTEHTHFADPQATPSEDLSPGTTPEFSEFTNPEESSTTNHAPHFGDIEMATADLDAKIHIDDDEFAELDAYLHNTNDEIQTSDVDLITDFRSDDDEFAELDAYLNDTDDDADKRKDTDANADSDSIIINEADLEPINSPAYSDAPNTTQSRPIEIIPAKAAPADKAENADQPPESNVPSLILDDLRAARDEQLRPSTTPWVIGSLLLMLTLVAQVIYDARDELAKDASLRPWLISLCETVGCTLSQPYDLKQIDIIGREVRSHPSAQRALIASTTLINNARFVQPFPLLTVVFSDINGTQLARRRFTPREYLDNNVDLDAGMTPDMPVRIELELVDPGKAAVNYEFHTELDPRKTRPLT